MKLRNEVIVAFYLVLSIVSETFAKHVRVVGGKTAYIGDFPHLVSIRFLNIHFCAGSIVSSWHILSAGHCFENHKNDIERLKVHSGVTKLSRDLGSIHEIERIYHHPLFHWDYKSVESPHDICILRVKQKIVFNEFTQKIKLPTRDVFSENIGLVAGWGSQHENVVSTSDQLLKAPMTFYDHQFCTSKVPFVVFEDQFCAFHSNGVGTCDGDSGGSVVSNGELFGIISMTYRCASGLPDVHTKVYTYLDFINHIIHD